jgi:hypothetical protein
MLGKQIRLRSMLGASEIVESELDISDFTVAVAVAVKLPILQVYINQELDAEFIMGNDVNLSAKMFTAYIKSKALVSKSLLDSSAYSWPVENIYSDQLLNSTIQSNTLTVLKLYRYGCNKCSSIESFYSKIAKENPTMKFTQANINHIPLSTKATMSRLKGDKSQNVSNTLIDCLACGNSGFLPCLDCASKGYVSRGTMAVICPTCVGYKKTRCSSCGGRCIKCDV